MLDAVEAAGFPPNRGNTAYWGSPAGRTEGFGNAGASAGFQIFRPDFDEILLARAAAAGADICADAKASRVEFHDADLAAVDYSANDATRRAYGRFAIDCSGRSGIIARRGLRVYQAGHRMQAFLGLWRNDAGWDAADDDRTTVETYDDGWAWSLAISRNIRQVAVMLDLATTRTTRGPIAEAYAAQLARTRRLSAQTVGAVLERAWACDASLYSSSDFAGSQFLLVGDAASCIDPLSSFGVKKALASAWLAAIAVHTSLGDSQRRSLAMDFFAQREREVYAADLARTRGYARAALEHHGHAFWKRRASGEGDDSAAADDSARVLRRPSLQHAHERLRASGTMRFDWNPRIAFVKRPFVRGREIVLDDAIPFGPAALRYAEGVDLIALGHCVTRHRRVPDAFDEYCRAHGAVSLSEFLAVLSLLVADDVLTPSHTSVHAR